MTEGGRSTKAWAVAVLLAAALLLTACGPPSAGTMSVTVDARGRPVGVLEVCQGHIDGATLYETPVDDSDESAPRHMGDWVVSPAVASSSRLDLGKPTGDWRTEAPLTTLQPGRSYTLYGWTTDNSWSAGGVEFSDEDLKLLRPGQIRYDAGLHADEENPEDTTATVPAGEFHSRACD